LQPSLSLSFYLSHTTFNMSNLYQMMCQTGSLPTPKRRDIRRSPPLARWGDDDPDSVASPPSSSSNRRASPPRKPLHEDSPIAVANEIREIFWKAPMKEDEHNDDSFVSDGSSGAFQQQRCRLQFDDCREDCDLSHISDPAIVLLGATHVGRIQKRDQGLPPIESDATESITSSGNSFDGYTENETRRNGTVGDISVNTDSEDFVFEDDDTEVSPEFLQCFPPSLNLIDSDSYDVMTQASVDDCSTVLGDKTVDVEAFNGDLWNQMHTTAQAPVAIPDGQKHSAYNRYKDLQTPTKKAPIKSPQKRFHHFKDITVEAKTQSMYDKLDEKVQQLLMGSHTDMETLQQQLDAMRVSTVTNVPRRLPPPRTDSLEESFDPIESSTRQPVFIKRCPTLKEVRRQEEKYRAFLSSTSPSTSGYYPRIESD